MKKDIKDYLHLYLGCECNYRLLVQGTDFDWHDSVIDTRALYSHLQKLWEVKPILRPLPDMTKEEAIELAKIHKYDIPEDNGVREELINIYSDDGELHLGKPYLPISMYKDGLLWLLKQGFDLFGLIDAGLAIDKTTISLKVDKT